LWLVWKTRGPEQHFWQTCESERAGLLQFLDLLNGLSIQYKKKDYDLTLQISQHLHYDLESTTILILSDETWK